MDNKILELPNSWVVVKLGDFVENEKGKKPKNESKVETTSHTIPYVDIQAFEEKVVRSWTDGSGCRLCYETDFLMVWDGSRSGLVGKGINGALGSTLVRIYFPSMVNDYAFYFLQSKYQQINTRAKGVGIPHVDPALLWNYDFPVPPLNEQHRIVAKIEELFSELDKGIENLKTAQAQLKMYRQALLKHAFEGKLTAQWRKQNHDKLETATDLLKRIQQERAQRYQQQLADWEKSKSPSIPLLQRGKTASAAASPTVPPFEKGGLGGISKPKAPKPLPPLTAEELAELPELPERWCWEKLGNIADLVGGVTKGKDLKGKEKISLPYLRVANVQDGYLDLTEIKHIEVEPQDKNKYRLEFGDVLYTEGGDKDKLGRGAVWRSQIESCIHQNHIFRARVFGGVISPEILSLYSQTKSAKKYFFRHAKQTTNLASINLTVLANLPVTIVCQSEQKQILQEIAARLSEADQLELTLITSLQQAEALRQSILKRAFSGQLVPQDPHDEPASALLARIKADKMQHTREPKSSRSKRNE